MRATPGGLLRPTAILIVCVMFIFGCASTEKKNDKGTDGPLRSLTLMRQGSVFYQQGRFADALERFKEAEQVAPGNATNSNMIGLCYLNMDDYASAMTSFTQALAQVPAFTDARNNRGVTYLALEQFHLAEVDFAAVLGDNTYAHHWETYFNLGVANMGQKHLAAAEQNFRRAITAPSPVFPAYIQLANLKQEQGDIDEAIDLLEEAELKFPDQIESALALGRLLTTLDRQDEARPYLEKVIRSYPNSAIAEEARTYLQEG